MVFSTNDYTTASVTQVGDITRDGWADTKSVLTPGGSRIYSVGVTHVLGGPAIPATGFFSFVQVDGPVGWFGITPSSTPGRRRKVVVLQAVDSQQNQQSIAWQTYLYGRTQGADQDGHETNPRAVAVWAAEDPSEVRIAICGETFDEEIPQSQPGAFGANDKATGFIAVYNGNGLLLWTHHLFGPDATQKCAVTDLSIRVVEVEGEKQDLVTYCGISTFGLVSSGPLTPVAPFTQLPPNLGYNAGVGNSNTGAGQWDGFVGRLRRDRLHAVTTTDFHSIVGGNAQDGLFGLAELDEYFFIVTGSTRKGNATFMPLAYPFTGVYPGGSQWNSTSFYSVGVWSLFDTSTFDTTGLQLSDSRWIGSVGGSAELPVWTHGHDVAATPYIGSFCIVGGTNDDSFLATTTAAFSGTVAPGSQSNVGTGDCDGFVIWRNGVSSYAPPTVGIFGEPQQDVITGVSMWGEYGGYAAFSGWLREATGPRLACGSISQGSVVRRLSVPSLFIAQPATTPGPNAMFAQSPPVPGHTDQGPFFVVDEPIVPGFGYFSSGGVGIDDRGRANVVGMSFGGYPSLVPNFPSGLPPQSIIFDDAVRSTVDMLSQGVSRTDGTGTRVAGTVPPWVPPPQPFGYDGGTTPTGDSSNPCRAALGWQIGSPLPEVHRILIDYYGAAPAPSVNAIIASEGYMGSGGFFGAVMQIGLPPALPLLFDTTEVWTVFNPQLLPLTGAGWAHFEWQLPQLIASPLQITVQVIWLVGASLSCDSSGIVASPGIVIDY